jgi:chorismate lyase / 3-hydroxybenzoate synthase
MTQTPIAAQLNAAAPRFDYLPGQAWRQLPDDVLFAVTFGDVPAPVGGAHVALAPLAGAGLMEVWYACGPVRRGAAGGIRFSADDHFLAGVIEIDEAAHDGIVGVTAHAYRDIAAFLASSRHPYLLRTWNYFDAINEGAGDGERYRGFCTGRVAGLADWKLAQHPAATVIGRRDGKRVLQVYWLAGRKPGVALDNPRQVSPWRYPREYGETAPTFSRAMLVSPKLLLVSGTASIVGHVSQHPGDTRQQLDEILANLKSMLEHAQAHSPLLPKTFGGGTRFKAYVRNAADAVSVEEKLRSVLPGPARLILQGDVCRSDLLVEFDCLHGPHT